MENRKMHVFNRVTIFFAWFTGLESLPEELQKSFNLMRDLDSKVQDLLKDIDKVNAYPTFNCLLHEYTNKLFIIFSQQQRTGIRFTFL